MYLAVLWAESHTFCFLCFHLENDCFVSTGDANYKQTFFGWRFVHLLLNRAEDNKAALYSNNTFHQRISELFENVTFCPSAAFWQEESNLGPLTKNTQAFPSGHSCSDVLSISLRGSRCWKVSGATSAVPVPSSLSHTGAVRWLCPQLPATNKAGGSVAEWPDPEVPLAVPAQEIIADISICKAFQGKG